MITLARFSPRDGALRKPRLSCQTLDNYTAEREDKSDDEEGSTWEYDDYSFLSPESSGPLQFLMKYDTIIPAPLCREAMADMRDSMSTTSTELILKGCLFTKGQSYTEGLACFNQLDPLTISGLSGYELLCYARCLIRAGSPKELPAAIDHLSRLLESCGDNNFACDEARFELEYFPRLLAAIAYYKMDDEANAEMALSGAGRVAGVFRLNSISNPNSVALQLRHYANLGELLGQYLTDDDEHLTRSELFRDIWELRTIETDPLPDQRRLIITKINKSPFFISGPIQDAEGLRNNNPFTPDTKRPF